MYQIINVKHTAGKMDNGAEYDNYKFTCLSDTDSKALVCGRNVEVFSCPASTFENVCRSRNLNRLAFEGCYLEPNFNQYGKVIDFKISEPGEG